MATKKDKSKSKSKSKSRLKRNKDSGNTHFKFHDPFYQREKEKYENPVPSREYIITTLSHAGSPLANVQLRSIFGIKSMPEKIGLDVRLNAMVRDNQLNFIKGNYSVFVESAKLEGEVLSVSNGMVYVGLPKERKKIQLQNARDFEPLFPGDKVNFYLISMVKDQAYGKIAEILEKRTVNLVGVLEQEGSQYYIKPVSPLPEAFKKIRVIDDKIQKNEVSVGDVIVVEVERNRDKFVTEGKIVRKVMGQSPALTEVMIATYEFDLPHIFPDSVLDSLAPLPEEVEAKAKAGRIDITHLPLVTIDGEDAKDFDDAVYCVPEEDGFRLYVAIADVSYYVTPKTDLDKEAYNRSTSVYFPGSVIPMLPEKLSNGLCSLKPNVDRLCMVCDMSISHTGKVKTAEFYPAVMNSKARLTYTQVSDYIEHKKPLSELEHLHPQIDALHDLYGHLVLQRHDRGAIDFDTIESVVKFADDFTVSSIVPLVRRVAHKIIEECMLCANVAAAKFLLKNNQLALYRVHEGPTDEKLADLRAYLGELGLQMGGKIKVTPKDYGHLIASIQDRGDKSIIETILLRSLSQAIYTPNNNGHFGLAYKAYTHFTSPIRRYPDLIVHRAIKNILNHKIIPHDGEELPVYELMGEHCSMAERRADEASRSVVQTLKCYFMENKIGEVYEGFITGVTNFGIFVQIVDIFVDGLIHISSLGTDYFEFDSAKHRLIGERTGEVFQLGDKLKIQVVRVDVSGRKIDFDLVGRIRTKGKKAPFDDADKKGIKDKGKEKTDNKKKSFAKKTGGKDSKSKTGNKRKSTDFGF